jgi:hypothetical protein
MKKNINKPSLVRQARLWLMPFLLVLAMLPVATQLAAQSTQSLEFASNGASTSATGPTIANQLITFERNTNNPTGNTFITQTPTRTVTFSLTNQQRTMASAPNVGLYFGGAAATNITAPAAYAIYPQLGAFGGGNATHFRSWAGTATSGSEGISPTSNYSVEIMASTRPMYESNEPLPTAGSPVSYQMADLVLTFNSPVSNPIIHFSGLGGSVAIGTTTPISAEFVLLSSGLSLTRLSGSTEFSVPNSTEIRNSAPRFTGTAGAGGASGSVRVNGTNITSISFRVYLTAQYISTGNAWALGSDAYPGDGFLVSVSLNACNSGATPSVQNISNTCPATTVDLNSAHTATAPAGSSLVWYTTSTRDAGTQVTGAGITAAGAGTYYAFYYDSANNCYSAASNAVTVTINSCVVCNAGTTQVPLNGSTLSN